MLHGFTTMGIKVSDFYLFEALGRVLISQGPLRFYDTRSE